MGNLLIKFFLPVLFIILSGCTCGDLAREYPESFVLEVTNGIDIERKDASVFVNITMIKEKHPDFNPGAFVIMGDGKELSSQMANIAIGDKGEEIVFLADFSPKETKKLTVRYAKQGEKNREYLKRTQGKLSIKSGGKWAGNKYEGGTFKDTNYLKAPVEHTDHSEFIRFEGPGWESDKVVTGYTWTGVTVQIFSERKLQIRYYKTSDKTDLNPTMKCLHGEWIS